MVSPPAHTWICTACGRRVPRRVDRCHCGATRAAAEAAPDTAPELSGPRPRGGRGLVAELRATMPRDVQVLLGAGLAVAVLGLGWLAFGPRTPDATPRVLGYVDAAPPPVPKPTPRPTPPIKLPWWK